MRRPFYIIDFDKTIILYINNTVYEIKVSDKRYQIALECIKLSKYDNLLKSLPSYKD